MISKQNLNDLFQLFPAGTIIETDSFQENILFLTKPQFFEYMLFSQDVFGGIFFSFGSSETAGTKGWECQHFHEILLHGMWTLGKLSQDLILADLIAFPVENAGSSN